MKINITCGQQFNNYLLKKNKEICIPFNEALIDGNLLYPLFDEIFIDERCICHNVSEKIYLSKISRFLNFINSISKDDDLVLWFGSDTFCQINLLGLLTYLEQTKCNNKIYLNIINEENNDIIEKLIPTILGNFTHSYINLIKNNKYIETNNIYIDNAIKDYLYLKNKDNDIYKFIKDNKDIISKKELFNEIFKMTRKYGLADIQINKMIDNN